MPQACVKGVREVEKQNDGGAGRLKKGVRYDPTDFSRCTASLFISVSLALSSPSVKYIIHTEGTLSNLHRLHPIHPFKSFFVFLPSWKS